MKPLLLEMSKSMWAMSFEGLAYWGPLAHKMRMGEAIDIKINSTALLNVFDSKGNMVMRDEKGQINAPKNSVAVINMEGPLIKYGYYCTYGAVEIVAALKSANNNPNIIGIVVYFDGPGGSVSAIAPFVDFAQYKKKPIVGLYDQCCSAHLYAMLGISDYIMAENNISATIGSVGIVMSFMDNRKYLENMGYTFHNIYPDESEHKNEAFTLALEGKYDKIKKEMLSPLAIKFQDAVRAARPNLKEVEGVLTGKTFYTEDALKIGLADGQGNLENAMMMVRILSETNTLY